MLGRIMFFGHLIAESDSIMKRAVGILLLAGLLVLIFWAGTTGVLSLSTLKEAQSEVASFKAERPLLTLLLFCLAYILVTAASVPGAAILTIAAGAFFGVFVGTIAVSFSSTIGATLAFLTSRVFLRDWVGRRFDRQLDQINAGVREDGAFYLFSLRLVPIVPFFMVNLLMGLTKLRVWTFFWVSQVGMLLGTLIYVNAGTRLAELNSVSQISSPSLILSLAALGIAPWIGKALIGLMRRRRLYKGFTRPKRFDRNLIVIGAGAAGLVSAYIAATVKAKVTLVEKHKMGGDCLNTGCVPSKTLIKSAKVAYTIKSAEEFGVSTESAQIDFEAVMSRISAAVNKIAPHDSVERYSELGVDVRNGEARLIDPWTVEITDTSGQSERVTTRAIVLATGAEPVIPDIPGLSGSAFFTSDTIWDYLASLKVAPEKVVVLGGGPIGCELAQALARLGSRVSLVERGPTILPREDNDVSEIVGEALTASGVRVKTSHSADRVEVNSGVQVLRLRQGDHSIEIEFDVLIIAVGRRARQQGYGLEALGIGGDKFLDVNGFMATRFPNIFAAGDVAGPYQFTHTASHQAWYASVNALFGQFRKFRADYRVIPWTTFIDPEVARVGLNEIDARRENIAYEVTTLPISRLDRAVAEGARAGFVKVLTAKGSDRILGAVIVSENAGEMIAEYVLAMKHRIGLNKILATVHAYPTLSESSKLLAGEWRRQRAPRGLLKIAETYHRWRRGK
ncbi:MAG TPA: FAD-dependent oxidoreductase [Hyphomonas sp.]|nr:FAD-dependent oxidoreductase [Hyphomonas sp.]HRK65931.1 FAD-dependent oxidoreductase [Hyphomonas sp.]